MEEDTGYKCDICGKPIKIAYPVKSGRGLKMLCYDCFRKWVKDNEAKRKRKPKSH